MQVDDLSASRSALDLQKHVFVCISAKFRWRLFSPAISQHAIPRLKLFRTALAIRTGSVFDRRDRVETWRFQRGGESIQTRLTQRVKNGALCNVVNDNVSSCRHLVC